MWTMFEEFLTLKVVTSLKPKLSQVLSFFFILKHSYLYPIINKQSNKIKLILSILTHTLMRKCIVLAKWYQQKKIFIIKMQFCLSNTSKTLLLSKKLKQLKQISQSHFMALPLNNICQSLTIKSVYILIKNLASILELLYSSSNSRYPPMWL